MPFRGSIFLFRLFGITVRLHWSWIVVAVILIELQSRYGSPFWMIAEYLTLFAIVLTHEFGHALACRSVGGRADNIILWPLGGIAFVSPPPRAGAVLWSIAAGPLVNVALVPITIIAAVLATGAPVGTVIHFMLDSLLHWDLSAGGGTPFQQYVLIIAMINLGLLVFNMIPIYPLDGGQIFQSLLWFVVGRTRSLKIASAIGLVAAVVIGLLCLYAGQWWLVIMAVFLGSQAVRGYRIAQYLAAQERATMERPEI